MAINAYCGVMGSGKSYEVVSGPLLDAVALGRRVVTNIDGVNEDLIHQYLHEKRGIESDRLGRVVHVRTEDLLVEGFFPIEVESSDGAAVIPGVVLPGDFVVVDEAWKLWASDKKISPAHMAFFRMHRHFVHPDTGVACDVALMIQSIADLHRHLKAVIELSFSMTKLKSVGLSSGCRRDIGSRCTRDGSKTRRPRRARLFANTRRRFSRCTRATRATAGQRGRSTNVRTSCVSMTRLIGNGQVLMPPVFPAPGGPGNRPQPDRPGQARVETAH
ncbi:zona occludens toxin, partial [Paraburkholderia lycopersici]